MASESYDELYRRHDLACEKISKLESEIESLTFDKNEYKELYEQKEKELNELEKHIRWIKCQL